MIQNFHFSRVVTADARWASPTPTSTRVIKSACAAIHHPFNPQNQIMFAVKKGGGAPGALPSIGNGPTQEELAKLKADAEWGEFRHGATLVGTIWISLFAVSQLLKRL